MDLSQFKQKFIEEAQGLLNNLDTVLLELEKTPDNSALVDQIFRIMHTLKGTGGMYGFTVITEVTHNLETIYDLVRNNKRTLDQTLIDFSFVSIDVLRNSLNQSNEQTISPQAQTLIDKLASLNNQPTLPKKKKELPQPTLPSIKKHSWNLQFTPNESLIDRGVNVIYIMQDLTTLGKYEILPDLTGNDNASWNIILVTERQKSDIEDVLMFVMDYFRISLIADFDVLDETALDERDTFIAHLQDQPTETLESSSETPRGATIEPMKPDAFLNAKQTNSKISVEAAKLDTLVYLVSELVTTKSELQMALDSENLSRIKSATENIDKLAKLFRDNALSIRLISLRDMLSRFQRLVRDLAKQLDKKINFELVGEDTELDKSIIEAISEPMLHILRNSIDHGIEPAAERLAANKPEVGTIRLVAYKKGNFVFIEISDDGGGLNKQKIRAKAIAQNLVQPDQQLTDSEIYELIFVPGFSTAEQLSQISGRGVGMDVVRKKIQEIRGHISLSSTPGKGTCFTLKLQQTIAIIDTLLVQVGDSQFAIPLEDIENCQLIRTDELQKKESRQFSYQNELMPYISLHREFEMPTALPEKQRMVIINKLDKRFAIATHRIVGEYQAVVKPLGSSFSHIEFLNGACILGDGSIALLLDTDKLRQVV